MKVLVGMLTMVCLGSGVLLSGCRTSVNTVENADKAGVIQYVRDSRVVTDHSLEGDVVVASLAASNDQTGLLRVQVDLLNRSNSIQTPFYQIEWVDENGMKVNCAAGGWKQQQLMPRESIPLVFVAPSVMAKDFRVKLMEDPR